MSLQIDQWYIENLRCPVDKSSLIVSNGELLCSCGRSYPVVDGIPVMLRDDVPLTIDIAAASLKRARDNHEADKRAPELYLESLGISEDEKKGIVELYQSNNSEIDPVVAYMIGATSGYSYISLLGNIREYPIPNIRLSEGNNKLLLDIGCNWGRWSIAAARKGYVSIGIDPSLGAVMAARRVTKHFGLNCRFVVGDARYLPFKEQLFDTVFSYSVLQHFSKPDVRQVLMEIAKVEKQSSLTLIQMANFLGIRSIQHQMARGFRKPSAFDVRYWSIGELKHEFSKSIGPTSTSVDCFFGLGLQKSDMKYMATPMKVLIYISEILRKLSKRLNILKYFADSVYVKSIHN